MAHFPAPHIGVRTLQRGLYEEPAQRLACISLLKLSGYCDDQEKEEEHTAVDSEHVSLECRTLRGPLGSCMAQCGPNNRDLCRVRTVRKVGRRGEILGICARRKMQGSIVQGFD